MEIMGALWEIGQASMREIQERLPKRDRPAYTTVQTIVRAGCWKGGRPAG
jgi:predicted transcriptional regulator